MTGKNVALSVFGCSDVGRVRKSNEDAFVIADSKETVPVHATAQPIALEVGNLGILLAVSDGMGGEQAGEVASALTLAVSSLRAPRGTRRNRRGGTDGKCRKGEPQGVGRCRRLEQKRDGSNAHRGAHSRTPRLRCGGRRFTRVRLARQSFLSGHARSELRASALRCGNLDARRSRNVPVQERHHASDGNESGRGRRAEPFHAAPRRPPSALLGRAHGQGQGRRDPRRACLRRRASTLRARRSSSSRTRRGGEDNITVVVAEMSGEGLPELTGEERVSLETVQAFTAPVRATSFGRALIVRAGRLLATLALVGVTGGLGWAAFDHYRGRAPRTDRAVADTRCVGVAEHPRRSACARPSRRAGCVPSDRRTAEIG